MKEDPKEGADRKEKSPWAYLHCGSQYGITVGACAYLGWLLDQRYAWDSWGVVIFTMIGVGVATYHLIKEVS